MRHFIVAIAFLGLLACGATAQAGPAAGGGQKLKQFEERIDQAKAQGRLTDAQAQSLHDKLNALRQKALTARLKGPLQEDVREKLKAEFDQVRQEYKKLAGSSPD